MSSADRTNGGFSFCGVDIESLSLYYAPESSSTYVYQTGEYNVSEESFEAHDGGYFYGTSLKPKDFKLRCYFNDKMTNGIISKIEHVFKRGTTGKLIFTKRDWIYYIATVVGLDLSNVLNVYCGYITITLRAYDPYAHYSSITAESLTEDMINNSALLLSSDNYLQDSFIEEPVTINVGDSNKVLYLYNGGTQQTKISIELNGTINGTLNIANNTTKENASFIALSSDKGTIVCDGNTGKTYYKSNNKPAFLYHDYGFISLLPAYPCVRNVISSGEAGSNVITISCTPTYDMIGKQFLDGNKNIYDITNIDIENNQIIINSNLEEDLSTSKGLIAQCNKIILKALKDSCTVTYNFIYKPAFA